MSGSSSRVPLLLLTIALLMGAAAKVLLNEHDDFDLFAAMLAAGGLVTLGVYLSLEAQGWRDRSGRGD